MGAPSTLHRSVSQQNTGHVWPKLSTSQGTHSLVQDMVTVASPRKEYTVVMGHQRQAGQVVLASRMAQDPLWGPMPVSVPPQFSPSFPSTNIG